MADAIQTKLSEVPLSGRFKYYSDGPTWIVHTKEAKNGYWHIWVQQLTNITCSIDRMIVDSADQFVYYPLKEAKPMHEYQKLNIGPAMELEKVAMDQKFVFFDNKKLVYEKCSYNNPLNKRAVRGGGTIIYVRPEESNNVEFALSGDHVHVVLPKPKVTLGDLKEGEQFQFKGNVSSIGNQVATKLSWFNDGPCCENLLNSNITNRVPIRVGDKLIFSNSQNEVERYVPF